MALRDGLREALEAIAWPPADEDAVAGELGLEPVYSKADGRRVAWHLPAPRRWERAERVLEALAFDHGSPALLEGRRRVMLVPKAPEAEPFGIRKLAEPVATAAGADYLVTLDVRQVRSLLRHGQRDALVHRLDFLVELVNTEGVIAPKRRPESPRLVRRWEAPLLHDTRTLLEVGAQLALFVDAPGAGA